MMMATPKNVAQAIMELSYSDLIGIASELVNMQKGAKDDGWEWLPSEVHGQYGLAEMLHAWAESQE
jgi:hypothetical protein